LEGSYLINTPSQGRSEKEKIKKQIETKKRKEQQII